MYEIIDRECFQSILLLLVRSTPSDGSKLATNVIRDSSELENARRCFWLSGRELALFLAMFVTIQRI